MSSHRSSQIAHSTIVAVTLVIIVLSETAESRIWSDINCMRYVFHPKCRGVSAKRSLDQSLSSSSSSSQLFRPMSSDSNLERNGLLDKLLRSAASNAGEEVDKSMFSDKISSAKQDSFQQLPDFSSDKDSQLKRQLQVLLRELQSKEIGPRESYRFFPAMDSEDST